MIKAVHIVLRVLILGILVLLLINPYVRHHSSVVEQPVVILAHDNSASLVLGKDSMFYQGEYQERCDAFREELSNDFQVHEYLFGQEVREFDNLGFTDQLTNVSALLKSVERRYYKRNVGAMLLFTDGIYNRGLDPLLLAEKAAFPIHTVVLGDTLSIPDLALKDIHYNKKVSLGATFPLRVETGAVDCAGKKAVLTVAVDGRFVAREELEINNNRYVKEVDFMLEADAKGVRQIEIEISGLENESQKLNNVKRIFVEVQDQKYKVLCLADAPHPDLGAIKSVLNDDCEMDFVFGRDELPDLAGYQLLLLHQTPSKRTDLDALVTQINRNKKIPLLVVVGGSTDIEALNKLQSAVELRRGAANTMLDVKGYVNTSFSAFTISEQLREKINRFPPLAMPYIEINTQLLHDDLLLQEVLGVKSGQPMMAFVKGDRKLAFLFGTNVWRWRLYNYYQDRNSVVFDELFSKTLKYLMLRADDGLAVFAKEEYYTNESVTFSAELRNPSNELVTEPELKLQIVNKKTGETYDYVFAKREHDYELNASILPEGVYTYRAQTNMGEQTLSASGSFSVVALGIEAQQLTADVALLRSLSATTDGKCYTVDQFPQLLDDLRADSRITSVEHHETRFEDLIHSRWILAVLIGLAAIEWLLRKMFGTY